MDRNFLSPVEVAKYILKSSEAKVRITTLNTILLGIMAGMFVGFGGFGYILVGQTLGNIDVGIMKFIGAAVFPVGLMLVVFTGSELFTGNTMMTMGLMDKRISLGEMSKAWILVYIGNFIGSVILAFIIFKAGFMADVVKDNALNIASGKMSLSFGAAVLRGVLCNILVVLAIWFSYAAQDVSSKIWGIWFPVMLFVLAGFEHSVANMFFLPLAKFSGAGIGWVEIFTQNIIPVTIGNIIAGGVLIPVVYYLAHIKPLSSRNI